LSDSKLLQSWRLQFRNLQALLLRDLMLRYGRDNIGFGWAVVEPMILCCGVMLIWSMMGDGKGGVRVIDIVFTGYMPLTLWRHMTNGAVHQFRRSVPLLYHRQLSLFDIVLSRQILEFIGTTAALAIVWSILYSVGVLQPIARPDLFLTGWLMMGWFSLACSGLFAAMTELSETSERFIQPLQYLNIPLSGSFFLLDWMPSWAQSLLMLHPHTHCYEIFREGYFGEAVTFHYDLPYFFVCAFVTTFLGVWAINKSHGRVQLT
jgi:capsular polysaccharide transport system permease protein